MATKQDIADVAAKLRAGWNIGLDANYLQAAEVAWHTLDAEALWEASSDALQAGYEYCPSVSVISANARRKMGRTKEPRKTDCEECRGSGIVHVIAWGFVRRCPTLADAESTFGKGPRSKWLHNAKKWWDKDRARDRRPPITYTVWCDCAIGCERFEQHRRRPNRDQFMSSQLTARHVTWRQWAEGKAQVATTDTQQDLGF